MPQPEIADVTMESIDLTNSPKKMRSAPSSPQKPQVTNYGSESDEGALAPLPLVSSRKQPNRVRRRPRRAMSAPVEEDSESGESVGMDMYNGPRTLSNHYTMHVNAPGSAIQATSSYAPHILLGYVRVIFNTSLVLGFLYILVVVLVTVRRDIEDKVSAYTGENAAEIQQCVSQYLLNKCDKPVVPHMEQFCDEWKKCMQRDASVVGRARIAAETLAEVVNGFVEPISWKTLGFSISTLAFLVLFINVSASFMRPAPPPPQPEYQAPPYPYHAPYAVMPPEWGNMGQGEPGSKMIRASSEVPGRERRSVSVRR
ncbi:Di-sulfide bridge nucleocytoplasmic transport domain-containing protein [Rhizoctonia solani]|nr:Di-sulfide bridge nucleocytoplasmic transport domain-containing protein [Rhizoctonia solani]